MVAALLSELTLNLELCVRDGSGELCCLVTVLLTCLILALLNYNIHLSRSYVSITLICVNIGTSKTIYFVFGTNGKFIVLCVPAHKQIKVNSQNLPIVRSN